MITIMDFYADWCGPCKAMSPILEKVISQYPDKITLEKINVDENQDKAREYRVMGIPTFVIAKDGKEVDRRTGLLGEAVLRQWVDDNL